MNGMGCEEARTLLPLRLRAEVPAGQAEALASHLSACDACAVEAELAESLFRARPAAPEGLSARIQDAVARDRAGRVRTRPWWGLAAAAVAAVALGIGVGSDGAHVADVPIYAAEAGVGEAWMTGDGDVAGSPLLDELSDDALEALLEELADVGAGGAA